MNNFFAPFGLFFAAILLVSLPALVHGAGEGVRLVEQPIEPEGDVDKLCGVRALYLALNFLHEKDVDYEELLKQFPLAKTEGTSLEKLAEFLQAKNYAYKYARIDKTILNSLNENAVVFVLTRTSDIPHIHLLRKLDEERFQIIDPPNIHSEREIEKIGDKVLDCLIVAKFENDLPSRRITLWNIISVVAFFVAIGLILYSLLKRRVKHAET
jgi:hypothetical protein